MRELSTRSLLSVLLLSAAVARADDAETRAKERFKAAQAAYDLGQFDKALLGYSDAYALKPLPAFLFNIAQCHKQLGHWEQAAFFYRRFASLAPEGADSEKLKALISQMDQKRADEQQRQAEAANKQEQQKDSAAMQAHTLELEHARARTAQAEAEAAAQRAAEAAEQAKLIATTPPKVPLYQRWWLWAGIGGVVAAGAVTGVVVATRPHADLPTFGTVNAR
jgi:tetratricopeptide (TPR) repeat protein